jgi:hypothetical protein
MVQSEFNFDIWFVIYRFLKFQNTLYNDDIITFDFFTCVHSPTPLNLTRIATPAGCTFVSRCAGSFSVNFFFAEVTCRSA